MKDPDKMSERELRKEVKKLQSSDQGSGGHRLEGKCETSSHQRTQANMEARANLIHWSN